MSVFIIELQTLTSNYTPSTSTSSTWNYIPLTPNYTPRLPPPQPPPLNFKLHPFNLLSHPLTSSYTSTSTSTSYLKQHPFNLHLHPFKRKLNPSTSTSTPLPQTTPLNLHAFTSNFTPQPPPL